MNIPIVFNSKNALEKFSYRVDARVHWESKLTAAKEKIPQSMQNIIATCFQRVKYRLTVSNVYSQQFPLVDVYGAAIEN